MRSRQRVAPINALGTHVFRFAYHSICCQIVGRDSFARGIGTCGTSRGFIQPVTTLSFVQWLGYQPSKLKRRVRIPQVRKLFKHRSLLSFRGFSQSLKRSSHHSCHTNWVYRGVSRFNSVLASMHMKLSPPAVPPTTQATRYTTIDTGLMTRETGSKGIAVARKNHEHERATGRTSRRTRTQACAHA